MDGLIGESNSSLWRVIDRLLHIAHRDQSRLKRPLRSIGDSESVASRLIDQCDGLIGHSESIVMDGWIGHSESIANRLINEQREM